MFLKVLLFFSLISNLILIALFNLDDGSNSKVKGDLLVVTETQKQCILKNSNNQILSTENIYGPNYYDGYLAIYVESKYVKDSFEFRYSNCFYDSYMKVMNGESIDSAIGLYKSY